MADERGRGHLPSDREPGGAGRRFRTGQPDGGRGWWLPLLLVFLAVLAMSWFVRPETTTESLTYSEFLTAVDEGEVESVTIGPDGEVEGERADGDTFTTTVPTAVPAENLLDRLSDNDVAVEATPPSDGTLGLLLINLLPFVLIIGAIWWFSRRARSAMSGGGMMDIGKSKAKEIGSAERPDTRFDDVAGYSQVKREVREIVDFLRRPDDYRKVGARGPGGVLLVGPPGTGKTMLARAVAGEAEVPFFAASGSEFVEMIVGVGASRVRDLFDKARKKAPAIIFIDELDSIGRRRGSESTIGSHNEQEQTLNQILAEMDGFDASEGIVVIAATNRAEMLDEALTRPGRFDRTIEVPLPRQDERVAILEAHLKSVSTADDLDVEYAARGTPGFSGADLKNLVNEAAVRAVRNGRDRITNDDLAAARDRVMLGHRHETSILRPGERERIAVHEAGHAVIGALTEHSDPVTKLTILPAGQALGQTEAIPLHEKRLLTHDEMRDMLAVMMGGRVAELALTGQASSGAANDLARATQLATRMVSEFGLSDELGPIGYAGHESNGYVPPALRQRPFAEETQRTIDLEAHRVLEAAEGAARTLLTDHRDALERLVDRLLEDETLDGRVVYEIVGREPPEGAGSLQPKDDDPLDPSEGSNPRAA